MSAPRESETERSKVFHADGVVTGDGASIVDGAVVFDGSGTVVDVGRASDLLSKHAGAEIVRVHGVVLPGLVNAHTHVELSALRGRIPGGAGFVSWVEQLVTLRPEIDEAEADAAVENAADDLDRYGITAVGEVSNALTAVRALARRGIGGWVFHEVFGVNGAQAKARIESLAGELKDRVPSWPSDDLGYAPAPHTLYTTHPDAVRQLLAYARERNLRTSVHLAEHAAERHALESGTGAIPAWYERRLKLDPAKLEWPHASPITFAETLGALSPNVLLVHLTDAKPDELDRVAASKAPVVLCPRSNLHIETRLPPLLAMRERGIEAALGTDSLASNASLDVLAEARALADRFSSVPARELLQMATWNGARALGRTDLGRLHVGARPGLLAVEGELPSGQDPADYILTNVKLPRRWLLRRMPTRSPFAN